MRHLSPEEFVDALDGAGPPAVLAHAATCAACREQLNELKALAREAEGVEVPEPSPLFWDHLSARVRTAIESETAERSSRAAGRSMAGYLRTLGAAWRVLAPVAALAGLAMVLFVRMPFTTENTSPQSGLASTAPGSSLAAGNVGADAAKPNVAMPGPDAAEVSEDESLAFVADLASGLDWSSAAEIGLTPSDGVEATVLDLDDAERSELQRLLNEAIGKGVTM